MAITIRQLMKNVGRSLFREWELVARMSLIILLMAWVSTSVFDGWWVFVFYFFSLPLQAGVLWFYLDLYRGEEEEKEAPLVWNPSTDNWEVSDYQRANTLRLNSLWRPFSYGFKFYIKIIGVTFFSSLFSLLWSILLIVPGIIRMISYSQALYLLRANPEMGVFECLRESRRLMLGKKRKYFLVTLMIIIGAILPSVLFILIVALSGISFLDGLLFMSESLGSGSFLYPVELLLDSNFVGAAFGFAFHFYYLVIFQVFVWAVFGGFHRELVGELEEDPLLVKSKQPVFSNVMGVMTAGVLAFSVLGGGSGIFEELGFASESRLFFALTDFTPLDHEDRMTWRAGGESAFVDDSTKVVLYPGVVDLSELFDGLPIWEIGEVGLLKAQQWLEPRLEDGIATLGSLRDLEAGGRGVILGSALGADQLAELVIVFVGQDIEVTTEGVHFMNALGAVNQVFDPVLNVYETYLYFPNAVFNQEDLSDELLLEWANIHREYTDYFSWVQIQLNHGHQLWITNTLHGPPAFLYRIIDPWSHEWMNLNVGEESQENWGRLEWVTFIGDEWVSIASPFGMGAWSPSTSSLIPVPSFETIAEYIEWANHLDWDLTIVVTDSQGRWIDQDALEEYVIHHVFDSYIGADGDFLWIEVRGSHEEGGVPLPRFETIIEYEVWLEGLGWGTELFVHDTFTGEELDPEELGSYEIFTLDVGSNSGSLYPHHTHLWIGVWLDR